MSSSAEDSGECDHDDLLQELKEACNEEDISRIGQLLTTTPLNSADATNVITEQHSVCTLQCLLEHGADANRARSRIGVPSLDVLKILAKFGYDVKAKGHLILQ